MPPSDSEDAEIVPRTVATLALTARRSKHLARSHALRLSTPVSCPSQQNSPRNAETLNQFLHVTTCTKKEQVKSNCNETFKGQGLV